ncbi:MAG: hypothetical protein ABEJ30_05360 [Halorientalis sp.]
MRRRNYLAAAGATAFGGLAGCSGLFETRSARSPPLVEDRPDAVYLPTHYEGMGVVGVADSEDGTYRCALTYTYPHRFWLAKPNGTTNVAIESSDAVHLMPVVWETATGTVPPDVNPQVGVARDGTSVAQFAPWPMLSQPMGFHFGDNVGLDGEGAYTVTVSVGGTSTRRTGALADSGGNASFAFEFSFSQSKLEEIPYTDVPDDRQGARGAVEPAGMDMLPSTQAPAVDAFPADVRDTATSGDAAFVVAVREDATRFGGTEDQVYLAVSPRTPHNRYVLPMMSLSGTLTRGVETVFDGPLRATLDPDLRYHYGAAVPDVSEGDELALSVDVIPQVARHEGYETAFVEMPAMRVTL